MSYQKSPVAAFAFWARNVRSAEMFRALRQYCRGEVLDVGGRDFYLAAKSRQVDFKTWTTLEPDVRNLLLSQEPDVRMVVGDGCRMDFSENSFDTVINIQVLEHVFDPLRMVREIYRVLRPNGHGIFLIPQTSVMHELPAHYYNFMRPWVELAMKEAGFKVIEIKPLGGFWSSMASHLVYFFFHVFRFPGYSLPECRRNCLFYLLFPVMALYAVISIPVCLLLSLGDLTEAPNNYLVIVQK